MSWPPNFRRRAAAWVHRIAARFADPYSVRSFSQEGEDIVLARLFEGQATGFFVDVGAHHPRRFSNTCYFYERGWHGIDIEPNPDAASLFRAERPRDIVLNVGISDQETVLTYYRFDEPALNSFDRELSLRRAAGRYSIMDTKQIPVVRLDTALKAHLPAGSVIDFLSVDVEGHELQVLRSNDWSVFRPRCLVVEALGLDLKSALSSPISYFLRSWNYSLFSKAVHTLFFLDDTNPRRPGGLAPKSVGSQTPPS